MSKKPFTAEDFAREFDVSRETLEALRAYVALLEEWQAKINLVGPSTVSDIWRRHILDSAQLLPFLPETKPLVVLDVGSGAGLPALMLARLGVGHVHLVESDSRKCAFLRAAARVLDIRGQVTIHNERLEKLRVFPVDVVTARAFAALDVILDMTRRFATEKTQWVLLKGQDVDQELTKAAISSTMSVKRHPSKSDPRGVILVLEKGAA